jgi:shikimate kinase
MMQNLFLIGLRGSGKSTLAPLLAQRLGWHAVDMDQKITERTDRSINEIFQNHGEPFFRDLESLVLSEIVQHREQVVATGGGVILRDENRRLLRENGWVVWLQSSPETMWKRIQQDATSSAQRPALTPYGSRAEIDHLLQARRPLYEKTAHFTLDTDCLTSEDSVEAILQHLPPSP